MGLVTTGTASAEAAAAGVPLWFQVDFWKRRQKPEEDRYFASFGRFIAAYAMAEAGAHVAARHFSGMPEEKGRIMFSGMRLSDLFDRLRQFVVGTAHATDIDALISHMNAIGDARDHCVHRLVEYHHGRGLVVTNRLTCKSASSPQPRTFTRSILDDMEYDCRHIFARFVWACGARDDVSPVMAGITLLEMHGPWRYTSPQPSKPGQAGPDRHESRKRQPRPSPESPKLSVKQRREAALSRRDKKST